MHERSSSNLLTEVVLDFPSSSLLVCAKLRAILSFRSQQINERLEAAGQHFFFTLQPFFFHPTLFFPPSTFLFHPLNLFFSPSNLFFHPLPFLF